MSEAGAVKRSHDYELGHTDSELKRLNRQALLVNPMTRQFFQSAGLCPGMRVLDVGSGAGDVAFLVAELVGPGGEVVGTDRSSLAVAEATRAAQRRDLRNVSFLVGDPAELVFDRSFDAVVGRYILCFSPDPVAMLRKLRVHLSPGGIMVFHEAGGLGAQSYPPAPLYDRCHNWIVQTFRRVGTNPQMCIDLYSAFVDAGLPAPTMALHTLIGGSASKTNGIDLITDLVTTLAPVIAQMGVATLEEIDIATLHSRVQAEVEEKGSILVGRYEIGAWSTVADMS
ncbi:class I SAM-dependent methyltransferase [Labrys okinawensis]|uniref:class I SAM-dependent methyltransferase n=1 Tax=Labrys okinawensis TaxID=346911 RepID=UPI0039BCD0BE